jgi:hypothetical protein
MPDAGDPNFCVSIYINKMQKLGSGICPTRVTPTFAVGVRNMPDAGDPNFCVSIYINKMQKLGSEYARRE